MTPEHRQLVGMLGNAGRLGPFCVWPNPPTLPPERNLVTPRLMVDGHEAAIGRVRPIEFVDPEWVAKGWEELKAGPPNEGCVEMPYCPKGWCTGQGDCPWSRRQLGNLRRQLAAPEPEPETHWYLAICQDCEPIFPQPFLTAADRDEWAAAHRTTGHQVATAEETR